MYASTASTILLTSILSTAYAFVPMKIEPLPSDLDTKLWVPLTTLTPDPTTATATPSSHVTPAPSAEEVVEILPVLDPNMVPELRKRQGVGEAVAATAITQVPPITTYQIMLYRAGTQTQLDVVYTQTFNDIPDQWPSPTAAGTIGLGTIQGTIGVVKSKRSLPTQAPMGPPAISTPTEQAPSGDEQKEESVPLLDKLRKAGKEIKEELEALVNKVKKPSSGEEEDWVVPLGKEIRVSVATENDDPLELGKPTEDESEEESTQLLPEIRIQFNDARVLKAGTLALIAVAIGTMCVNYL